MGEMEFDFAYELANTGETAFANGGGELRKEPLDHVEPRTGGRGEVHVEARVLVQPGFVLGMFVGGIVVGDNVNSEVRRCCPMNLFEEAQPFDNGCAWLRVG